MHDDIPWLDSSALIDDDGDSLSKDQGSIAPIELEVELSGHAEAATPAVPRRRRSGALAAGFLLASAAATFAFFARSADAPAPDTKGAPPSAASSHARAPEAAATQAPPPPTAKAVSAAVPEPRPAPESTDAAPNAPAAAGDAARASARRAELRAAFASLNAGKPELAVRHARAILDAAPHRADAWLVLGSAYDALHDRDSAQRAFRSCAERARGPMVRTCQQLIRD